MSTGAFNSSNVFEVSDSRLYTCYYLASYPGRLGTRLVTTKLHHDNWLCLYTRVCMYFFPGDERAFSAASRTACLQVQTGATEHGGTRQQLV